MDQTNLIDTLKLNVKNGVIDLNFLLGLVDEFGKPETEDDKLDYALLRLNQNMDQIDMRLFNMRYDENLRLYQKPTLLDFMHDRTQDLLKVYTESLKKDDFMFCMEQIDQYIIQIKKLNIKSTEFSDELSRLRRLFNELIKIINLSVDLDPELENEFRLRKNKIVELIENSKI